MNLYDELPDRVELDGKTYLLDLTFNVVLLALDVAEDERLTLPQRIETECRILLKDEEDLPESFEAQQRLLTEIFSLFPGGDAGGERYIDLHQDAQMILTAFYRIGIDLRKDRIHFAQFLELLSDLPSDTALMRTIEIRQRLLPKPNKHNAQEIAALQRAKQKVALHISEEERRRRFAASLKASNLLRG